MQQRIVLFIGSAILVAAGFFFGTRNGVVVHAQAPEAQAPDYARTPTRGEVPKSYGKLVAAIADSIGTGLVFEDGDGVIRFVSVTGMKEGELARYDGTPTHGGVPRSYGHLVSAVVNNGATALIFEDAQGVIRFVTLTGVMESELSRK